MGDLHSPALTREAKGRETSGGVMAYQFIQSEPPRYGARVVWNGNHDILVEQLEPTKDPSLGSGPEATASRLVSFCDSTGIADAIRDALLGQLRET